MYDAAGNKLQKIVTDQTTSPTKTTTTDYVNGFVYQNDTLQFFPTEEGRVRYVPAHGSTAAAYVYDYFIKDHLGNVRVVLTEQTDLSQYMATMEQPNAQKEDALFYNLDNTREARPPDYPEDNTTTPNTAIAKLNGSDPDKRIGPSIILKVMAGDTIQAAVRAYYKQQATPKNNVGVPAEQMLSGLVQALVAPAVQTAAVHNMRLASDVQTTSPGLTANDLQSLKQRDPNNNKTNKPKAYLNYVFFDKQLKFVDEGSGVKQVEGEPDKLETLASGEVVAKKDGFVYVYTSNESQQDVLFDNLGVQDITGPVLEETHYYPFGLTMAGISSTAPLKLANSYKYNSKELNHNEFSDGSIGLEWYSYGDREYDPQIGAFHALDPYPEIAAGISPYSYAFDNPVLFMDINGDSTVPVGDVKGDWSNFDTQNNSIGLNAITVTGHRSYYGSYDPLYTGAFNSFHVNWVSEGTGGREIKMTYKTNYSIPDVTGTIIGAGGLTWDVTRNSIQGVQVLGNAVGGTKYAIQDLGKLELIKGVTAEGAGHFILGLGVAISVIDIGANGFNWSNGTDLAMSTIAFVPGVGWVISGAYFIGNIVVKHYTGKSIGDYIGEGLQNPVVQGGFIQMSKFPNF